ALEWHSRGRGFDSPWLHHKPFKTNDFSCHNFVMAASNFVTGCYRATLGNFYRKLLLRSASFRRPFEGLEGEPTHEPYAMFRRQPSSGRRHGHWAVTGWIWRA